MITLENALGLFGSLLLITAYTKCVLREAFSKSMAFLLLNIAGSVFLLPSAFVHESKAATAICTFWIVASCAAMINKNVLSTKILHPLAILFTAFIAYSLFKIGRPDSIPILFKIVSLISVEIFVISYALFIGNKASAKVYFLSTLIGNALFIPCLYLENNIASITLQSFCLIMSVVGLIKIKAPESNVQNLTD